MGKKQKLSQKDPVSTNKSEPSKPGAIKARDAPLAKLLPSLKPRQLNVVDLLPSNPLTCFSIPNLLLPSECKAIIQRGDGLPWQNVSHPASSMYASRDNDRIEWKDPQLSQQVWQGTGLDKIFKDLITPSANLVPGKSLRAVGLNTSWRLYRYCKGQHFGAHFDDSVECPDFPGADSYYTLLVYLSDEFIGGETVFYQGKNKVLLCVKPELGLALFHSQGAQCLKHEGAEVERGQKWVLRSDVMFTE